LGEPLGLGRPSDNQALLEAAQLLACSLGERVNRLPCIADQMRHGVDDRVANSLALARPRLALGH
jgi:hypothetical protein